MNMFNADFFSGVYPDSFLMENVPHRVPACAMPRLFPRRLATNSMERYSCSKCNEEYFMKNVPMTGPPAGPHFCPDCGGELHWLKTEFGWIPNSYDMD